MGSLETPCENCGELVKKQRESQRRALLCPYAGVNGRIGLDGLVPARLSPACLHAGQPSQIREVPSVPGSALRPGLLGTPSAVLLMCHPVPFSEVSQRLSFCLRTRGRLRFCLQETFRSSKATVLAVYSAERFQCRGAPLSLPLHKPCSNPRFKLFCGRKMCWSRDTNVEVPSLV